MARWESALLWASGAASRAVADRSGVWHNRGAGRRRRRHRAHDGGGACSACRPGRLPVAPGRAVPRDEDAGLRHRLRDDGTERALVAPAPRCAPRRPRTGPLLLGRAAGARALRRGRARRRRARPVALTAHGAASTRQALTPPNPKEFETATPASRVRGASTTASIGHSGSRCRRPAMGGARRSASEQSVTMTSTAPEPPIMWPVVPFVAVTGGGFAENSVARARASAASFSGVDVPWALTWPTSDGVTPASSRARRMHANAPSPPGLGATR